ncbi:hypothetical protein G114_09047 [Aeromonas diversa CDC 2478-85]|uniref:GGDEF domain-containing protein n=1 Tax=Aeromonas diversa CDC 2478-85 TaxID=1268237 RepID=N9U1K9_9GAMM|nr:diguanylate cyclase [Aeromonas diversa]ENY72244.1 hypothetical protein G114_09047 [Aeromonas diversa CDC 2478-85]
MRRQLYNLLLCLTVLLFLVSSALTLYLEQKHERVVDYLYRTTYWNMIQLLLESQRFYDDLRLYRSGGLDLATLGLQYDLLWNRIDIFLVSEETAELRTKEGLAEVVRSLFANLKRLERGMDTGQLPEPALLGDLVERIGVDVRRIEAVQVRVLTGDEYKASVQQIRRDLLWLQLCQQVLVLAGVGLMLALIRANWQNRRLALMDTLTRLGNRRALYEALGPGWRRSDVGALVILDLKRFKQVNDQLGYQVGDRLLQTVARRLAAWPHGSAFRLGGDEFAVIVQRGGNGEEVAQWAESISQVIGGEFLTREHRITPRCRLGIALAQTGDDGASLLDHAILALDQAKRGDMGEVVFFQRRLAERLLQRQHRSRALLVWLDQGGRSPLEPECEPLLEEERLTARLLHLRWMPEGERCEPAWLDEAGMLERVVLPHVALLWRELPLPLVVRLAGVTPLSHLLDGCHGEQGRLIVALQDVGEWDEQLKTRLLAAGVSLALEEIGSRTALLIAQGWPVHYWLCGYQGPGREALQALASQLGLRVLTSGAGRRSDGSPDQAPA